jgi:hypothetical protein
MPGGVRRDRRCTITAVGERTLTREDLGPMLHDHGGQAALRDALLAAAEPATLLSVMARYVQFNSAFGAGVANLAGEIAARPGLFRDPGEEVRLLADRAADVASHFFYAAIDEFDDRLTPWRDTHRTLAQATVKGMGAFFGYTPSQLDGLLRSDGATEAALARVWEGYGVAARLDEPRLFSAMGFHAGSEVMADGEFNAIDAALRERHPAMVQFLEGAKVDLLGERHDAYYWIRIHTSVEADHFDSALRGVNAALRFYAGDAAAAQVKAWVRDGFGRFAELQKAFMTGLLGS